VPIVFPWLINKKRNKNKIHSLLADPEHIKHIPKTLIFRRGKTSIYLTRLIQDLRNVMRPWTAPKLRERTKNTLKDFLQIANPLGVTHFLILKTTEVSSYLKIGRVPQGPTLTFRILKYSTCLDIFKSQNRPISPGPTEFLNPVVLIRNGFSADKPQVDLMNVTFKQMFPSIPVEEVNLDNCKRTVLIDYNKDTDIVEFRHYLIKSYIPGLQKKISRIIQKNETMFGEYKDISECLIDEESDRESLPVIDTRIQSNELPDKQNIKKITLREIGPRIQLQLIKIQEGLCIGKTRYHKFYNEKPEKTRTPQET
jgi:ribosome biogenesis protein SSF1/2